MSEASHETDVGTIARPRFGRTPAVGFCWLRLGLLTSSAALVHEWNFNETSGTTFFDSVGTAQAQIVVLAGGGGYQLTGNAVRLDGGARATADYASFPPDIFDGLTNVTIEIWAVPHSFQNWGRVIDIGPGDSVPNPTADNFRLSFSVALDGNQQWIGLRPIPPAASALLTQTNQLYHYAVVWSATGAAGGGATIQWYRNGAFVTNQDVGSATIANLANLAQTATWLGRSAYTGDSTANASYHAMRIYNEALDAATIALHTLKGPDNDGPDGVDGLIHRWSFSETNITSLQDSIGSQTGQIIVLPGGGGYELTNGQLRLFGGAKDTADYAKFPPGLLDGLSNVTVEAWVTPRSAQNWARLFDFGSGAGITDTSFFLSLCRGTVLNQQRLEFIPYRVDTALATTAGQQYHYVAIWSATNGTGGVGRMEWHRDGVLAGGVDTGPATIANVDDTVLWLGRSQYPDATADADFNELRIYNRALTPGEINFNRLLGPDNVNIPPPDAVDDTMIMNPGAMALIPVLSNDRGSQPNPNTLTIVTPPSAGTAQVKPGGKILYTHNGGPATSDQFTYTVQNSLVDTSNVATVFITISAALRLPNTTITVPNTPPPVAYQVVNAFPGLFFEDAVAIQTPRGRTNQIFVAERRGIISYVPDIHAATPVRQVLLDIRNQVQFDDTPQGEMGLLGFDFHPGFATNGYFFVAYTAPGPRQDRLSRFAANPNTLAVNTNTQQIFFSVVDEAFNHNGSDVHFGPDGYLYMSMGDEGDQYNGRQNAQRIDRDFYSGLLRLDVDKRPGNPEPNPHAAVPTDGSGKAFYSIPVDNPYVHTSLGGSWDGTFFGQTISNLSLVRGEFFAVGLRHPWRFSIDPLSGEIWVGDVGQDRYEEVDIAVKGGNYGWAYYEATTLARSLYPNQQNLPTNPPPGLTLPIYHYIHAGQGGDPNFSGDSITGGVVYRGSRLPELYGIYLFADFEFAHLWALRRDGTNVTVERLASKLGIAGFGVDPSNGDVLIANYFDNQVQRLVRTDAVSSSFPPTLSDTGVFADLASLTPNPGIVSYEPRIAFWSDHGIKRRWFTIPDTTNTVGFAQDANWALPTGMKWIKHFDLEMERGNPASPKRRLETRILVKTDTGNYGVSYKWNDAQTEAFLVDDDGDTFNVVLTVNGTPTNQLWEIPSRAGCLACHSPAGGDALTCNTREMNHTANLNGIGGNQISVLSQAGYFSAPVPAVNTLPVYATATETNASLEFRARSYLAVNCVQCHQAGGASPGSWDARPYLTLAQTGLINGTPINTGSDPANKIIVPGDPLHSVLWLRIQGTNGFGRMPPLATHQLDQTAIQLLADWISSELTNRQTFPQWQIAHFGSTNNPSAAASADPDSDRANNYYEFLTRTSPLTNTPPPWTITIDEAAGTVGVNFLRLANLGFLVETSTNFANWIAWDVPGNQLFFGASNTLTTISGPRSATDTDRFFRVKIFEP